MRGSMNTLEIKGLTKHYRGFALDGVDLVLPQGCILGLIGENGAGKSTTIKLILNMIRAEEGSVRIFGKENVASMPSVLENVGVVLDEVGFPGCLNTAQIGKIMEDTYRNWEEETYQGYLKQLSVPEKKPFRDFSKGNKMKLGIAVALSHQAKLLILDEPTSGLDPVVRDQVVDILGNFTREESHAVLISSHIVSDLERICDYIAFLHQGKLMLCEEKDVLLEEYGLAHCTAEQLAELPKEAVKGSKSSPYGAEALVRKSLLREERERQGLQISPVTIEELFVYMVKNADQGRKD